MTEYWIILNRMEEQYVPTLEEFQTLFTKYKDDVISYCVSFEISSNEFEHFHLYLKSPTDSETWRNRFKRELKLRPRFSREPVRDTVRVLAYAIKDGDYKHHNLNLHEFMLARQISHPKRKNFGEALADLDKSYHEQNQGDSEYIDAVLDLYITYNKNFYYQHIIAHIHTQKMKKHKTFKQRVKERIKNEFNNLYV